MYCLVTENKGLFARSAFPNETVANATSSKSAANNSNLIREPCFHRPIVFRLDAKRISRVLTDPRFIDSSIHGDRSQPVEDHYLEWEVIPRFRNPFYRRVLDASRILEYRGGTRVQKCLCKTRQANPYSCTEPQYLLRTLRRKSSSRVITPLHSKCFVIPRETVGVNLADGYNYSNLIPEPFPWNEF